MEHYCSDKGDQRQAVKELRRSKNSFTYAKRMTWNATLGSRGRRGGEKEACERLWHIGIAESPT